MIYIIRPPGTVVPGGLIFYCWCFFFIFFATRSPSSHDHYMGALYNASPKIRGALPPMKLGAKNMQNSARFLPTPDFDREYLRNRSRYPKSENVLFTGDSARVPRKKSGELWSTNNRELDVSLDPPKLHFSGDYISALRGAGPSNFNTHYRLTKAC